MTLIEIECGKENLRVYGNNKELPTHEQIERRASQIYLEHGFQPGNALGDGLATEKELSELSETREMNKSAANVVPSLRKHATA
jgi:hypothetical protein